MRISKIRGKKKKVSSKRKIISRDFEQVNIFFSQYKIFVMLSPSRDVTTWRAVMRSVNGIPMTFRSRSCAN